eukprot:gene16193-21458_t
MIWFAVEPLVMADPAKALELATQSNLSLVSQFIASRAYDANRDGFVIAGGA